MRDPDRIEVMVQALKDVWAHNPDLRLGQVIHVATHYADCHDVFAIEDGDLLRGFCLMAADSP